MFGLDVCRARAGGLWDDKMVRARSERFLIAALARDRDWFEGTRGVCNGLDSADGSGEA